MSRSVAAAILLTLVITVSVLISSILSGIEETSFRGSNAHPRSKTYPFPDGRLRHINWFMQVGTQTINGTIGFLGIRHSHKSVL